MLTKGELNILKIKYLIKSEIRLLLLGIIIALVILPNISAQKSEEKQFIAECEILELPKPIEEHEDIDQNEWKEVPVVVRLEKIRDLNMPLDDDNWRYLNAFKDLKNRKSVSASLESKSRREIDILDYNFITNKE